MRTLEFKFQPQEVKISPEEILADLNYPAPAVRTQSTKAQHPRRKTRR